MIHESITVLDCHICSRKCNSVGITVDPVNGSVLIVARCHGREDLHLIEKDRIASGEDIILKPFAKTK